jgi:hypothetical protein
MSFQGMGKSINPMCDFLKPKPQGETMTGSALRLIVLMSLQPAIPWRVALLHCPPPLHRLDTILHRPANFVNHHPAGAGEFSTGTMGNFQPELTGWRMAGYCAEFTGPNNGVQAEFSEPPRRHGQRSEAALARAGRRLAEERTRIETS